jgi:hypothetical protein
VGTIQAGSNIEATYTAPDKAPNPNEVAVTVDIPPMRPGCQKVVLFSEITINDGAWLLGTWDGTIPWHLGDDDANPFADKALSHEMFAQHDDPENNPGGIFYSERVTFDGMSFAVHLPFDPQSDPNQISWDYVGEDNGKNTEDVVV